MRVGSIIHLFYRKGKEGRGFPSVAQLFQKTRMPESAPAMPCSGKIPSGQAAGLGCLWGERAIMSLFAPGNKLRTLGDTAGNQISRVLDTVLSRLCITFLWEVSLTSSELA